MGPFLSYFGNEYILSTVDYVSKCIKVIPTRTNDATVVVKFLRKNIFARFSMARAIISDQRTYFINRSFYALLRRYSIVHRLAAPYHTQTSGRLKCPIDKCNKVLRRLWARIERIGMTSL